ncbi:NAD(P)-dependent oxidoreductase [Neisseria perflava]|nr:NAD(P)-binding domain-containing protein [Neisseria perflava]MCP1659423.1 3-hydroxyisobutyrate dehydrogenase-like beta-hydroxyacid dehydrogenase [Neisseria perflava]
MTKIAFLGLGAMGSRMALNLVKAGYALTVWNRTASACDELVAAGAKAASTPREAVQGAEFVISMVRDDEASRQVWLDDKTGALAALAKNAVAVESSTLTPDWIHELSTAMQIHGTAFLEAPVSGSRPQAAQGQLI